MVKLKKLIVITCRNNENHWYKERIGDIFTIKGEKEDSFIVFDEETKQERLVLKNDVMEN